MLAHCEVRTREYDEATMRKGWSNVKRVSSDQGDAKEDRLIPARQATAMRMEGGARNNWAGLGWTNVDEAVNDEKPTTSHTNQRCCSIHVLDAYNVCSRRSPYLDPYNSCARCSNDCIIRPDSSRNAPAAMAVYNGEVKA